METASPHTGPVVPLDFELSVDEIKLDSVLNKVRLAEAKSYFDGIAPKRE